jgi:hypothetical protein
MGGIRWGHIRGAHTMGPPNVSGTNSGNSGACQSMAGSLLCKLGVLAAEVISMQKRRNDCNSRTHWNVATLA